MAKNIRVIDLAEKMDRERKELDMSVSFVKRPPHNCAII